MTNELRFVGDEDTLISTVNDWLIEQAQGQTTVEKLFEGCCNRLVAIGVPISRARLVFRTLHPLYDSISLSWNTDEEVGRSGLLHGRSDTSEDWRTSPFLHLIKGGLPFLRRRLIGEGALLDFPVLTGIRDAGATDYIAYAVSFTGDDYGANESNGIVGFWATNRESGYTAADIKALLRIQSRLAVACKVTITEEITRNVLATYLGPDAGRQVLNGSIRRGDGETIYAVVWYNDLRRSTRLTESMPADQYLALLNAYFECTAGAVLANQGDVLRFVGDAVLAIFPIRDGGISATEACQRALEAAGEAERRLAALNQERQAEGKVEIDFGIGLHLGDVVYGNIGVSERLEFSVIGTVANEVARLEGLTKVLGRRVLATKIFADNVPVAWDNLGEQSIEGALAPLTVFAPASGRSAIKKPA
jgi:adenylate cyclase